MFAGRDVAVHHTPPVHPRHRPGQPHRQPDQLVDGQRLRQPGQARAADVRQHDRPRVPRRLHQLRHPVDTAQPLQDRQLVPQPPLRVRPQRLLADDRAPGKEQPSHPRALALVHDLGPNGRISARQHPACPHPTPPRTVRTHHAVLAGSSIVAGRYWFLAGIWRACRVQCNRTRRR